MIYTRTTHQRLMIVGLALLAACAAPPAPLEPTRTSSTPAAPAPTIRPTVTPTAIATAIPTPPPTTAPATEPAVLAPPTATPPLPEDRFDDATLPDLRPLRDVGFGAARGATISPDGRLLAVATSAGLAYFELPSLRHLRFDPIPAGAQSVDFDATGRSVSVMTGSQDEPGPVERRSVVDGSLLETGSEAFIGRHWEVESPAGGYVATFNPPDSSPNPGMAIVRTVDSSEIYRDEISSGVSFSADESLAVATTYRGDVRLITLPLGAVRELELLSFRSVAFSPDAQTLAAAGGKVWLWDVISGELRHTLADVSIADEPGLLAAEQDVRFSADGSVLSVDGAYSVFEVTLRRSTAWRVDQGTIAPAWESNAGGVGVENVRTYVGATSPAADVIATTEDGRVLTIGRPDAASVVLQPAEQIRALAFSPDGALLAVGGDGGEVLLVRAADGGAVQALDAGAPLHALVFSPDGSLIGAQTDAGEIVVWRVGLGVPTARIGGAGTGDAAQQEAQRRDRFLFTADGGLLIAWGTVGVRFHRLSDGALVHRLPVAAEDIAVGPRRRLVAVLRGGRIELWGLPPQP